MSGIVFFLELKCQIKKFLVVKTSPHDVILYQIIPDQRGQQQYSLAIHNFHTKFTNAFYNKHKESARRL